MYLNIFKNMFTVLCVILTIVLTCQVIFTAMVTKPTTTSKGVRKLDVADLPEVVVCLDPGLDSASLERNGYHITTYWRGVMHLDGPFVGWKGNGSRTSREIFEEALHFPNVQIIKRTKAKTDFTHPSSIICPGSTGGRIYLVDSLSTGEGSCWLKKR